MSAKGHLVREWSARLPNEQRFSKLASSRQRRQFRADGEFTAKIIVDRQVWLATADALNDPLECQTGTIPEDWKRKTIREQEDAQIMGVLFDFPLKPVETLFSLDRRQTKQWRKVFVKLRH